ncbi:uncharacterized protein TRIVIDRAFT_222227 [Trichoderma virens Gv29-8]|uniref:Uncharacterized protein n=1 Tax=Hypocrea virens (strain Gv29-8 / FGSC 10586) TaxID=413071 RepID=G9MSB2_HYPVG|nr:uncharacterized protein TRIVIDRAFT_222227 [Trichoderma virens Gv29-8]EHK22970.1 hypothetical protein TRIVIDRAFT_222227 [Trichoderma virens Gv29-8]UKZ48024.1 hypothetical protein TrVGV298_002260 [Trichoderma virens]
MHATQKLQPSDEPLSLYAIAIRHCRERLIVQPLAWTNRQLELLQCSFSEPSAASPALQSNFICPNDGTIFLNNFFRLQPIWPTWPSRETAIRMLLASPDCPLEASINLRVYFGNRRSKKLPCSVFYPRCDNSSGEPIKDVSPVAAHIEYNHIASLRQARFLPMMLRPNPPVKSIRLILWKRHSPACPLKDPYIVAILIALAQRRKFIMSECGRTIGAETIFPVKLLLTSDDRDSFHLYSANIPSSFLNMFENPKVPPPSDAVTVVVKFLASSQ